jgi:antitoxin component of MazEF toxin-antitoxin module
MFARHAQLLGRRGEGPCLAGITAYQVTVCRFRFANGGTAWRYAFLPASWRKRKGKGGSRLEVTVQKSGVIALMPTEAAPSLHELMEAVTPANLHRETETGPALGNELW